MKRRARNELRYDVAARGYDLAVRVVTLGWIDRLQQAAVQLAALEPGARVADIGCGTGALLPALAAAVGPRGQVEGVDLSAEMVRRARRTCAQAGLAQVEVTRADVHTWRSPAPLDAVVCCLSLSTLPQLPAAVDHLVSQLAPGGRLVVVDSLPRRGRGPKARLRSGYVRLKAPLVGSNPRALAVLPDLLRRRLARVDERTLAEGVYTAWVGQRA